MHENKRVGNPRLFSTMIQSLQTQYNRASPDIRYSIDQGLVNMVENTKATVDRQKKTDPFAVGWETPNAATMINQIFTNALNKAAMKSNEQEFEKIEQEIAQDIEQQKAFAGDVMRYYEAMIAAAAAENKADAVTVPQCENDGQKEEDCKPPSPVVDDESHSDDGNARSAAAEPEAVPCISGKPDIPLEPSQNKPLEP